MREFARQLRSDRYRMRHSFLFSAHLLIPAAGIILYLLYMMIHKSDGWDHFTTYVTLVAMAYPAVTGVVTAMFTDRESRAGRMQNMLASPSRCRVLLAGISMLLLYGLLAVAVTLAGFVLLLLCTGYGKVVGAGELAGLVFILWAANVPLYLVHFFLGIKFGEGVTIGAGVAETVISGVMLTGLGEGVWYVWWPSYGMRFSALFLSSGRVEPDWISQEVCRGGICGLVISVLFLWGIAIWFSRFEGRKEEV